MISIAWPWRIAGRRAAVEFGRRIQIVARHAVGTGNVAHRGEGAERNGVAAGIAHPDIEHVARVHAVFAVGLRHHPEGAAEQVEVVDIGRAEIDLQRGEDVGHIDAEQLRLGAVDVEIELRRRGLEQREHLLHAGRLRRPSHHGVGRALQGLRAAPGAILDHHAEAAGIADAAHRRRRHHHHQRFLDGDELREQLALDRGRRLVRILGALVERLQHQEDRAGIRRVGEGRAGEADNVHRAHDAGRMQGDVHRPCG